MEEINERWSKEKKKLGSKREEKKERKFKSTEKNVFLNSASASFLFEISTSSKTVG
jgi:hypothetical protein